MNLVTTTDPGRELAGPVASPAQTQCPQEARDEAMHGLVHGRVGPYQDRLGTPLQHGGGTVILSERGTLFGPGGQDIYSDRHGDYLVHHGYDAQANGAPRLGIRRIEWKDGWPEVADAD